MGRNFGKSPAADYLGIPYPSVILDFDMAATIRLMWYDEEQKAERHEDMLQLLLGTAGGGGGGGGGIQLVRTPSTVEL